MGIHVITGGSKGIGESAANRLKELGHEVFNIDRDDGDIRVDLGTAEGRAQAIAAVRKRYPGGIDGLILNAGVIATDRPSKILSVNYFGVTTMAEGLFELLQKRQGKCAVTVSGSLAYMARGKRHVDMLLANCGDEQRICRLADAFEADNALTLHLYGSSKAALVRWIRRTAPSWAARGVNLNGLAPGAVETAIIPVMEDADAAKQHFERMFMSMPMPTVYCKGRGMTPAEVGPTLAMLVLSDANGLCGEILFCDGGTSSILHTEKYY